MPLERQLMSQSVTTIRRKAEKLERSINERNDEQVRILVASALLFLGDLWSTEQSQTHTQIKELFTLAETQYKTGLTKKALETIDSIIELALKNEKTVDSK